VCVVGPPVDCWRSAPGLEPVSAGPRQRVLSAVVEGQSAGALRSRSSSAVPRAGCGSRDRAPARGGEGASAGALQEH
jgi:hypothetical protein